MTFLPKMPEKDSTYGKLNDTTGTVVLKYWPIIIACALTLISLGGIYVKVDYIAKIMDKNDAQIAVIQDRQNLSSQSVIEIRGQLANLNETNLRTNSSISDLNRRVDLLTDKARWSPK